MVRPLDGNKAKNPPHQERTMSTKRFALAALLAGATFLTAVSVEARTLRWARAQDATTLDPHSGNTGPNHVMGHNIYEPLVIRGFDGKLVGALATEWRVLPNDPTRHGSSSCGRT
jgi:peptide/nickel transport system substrate-binding protein